MERITAFSQIRAKVMSFCGGVMRNINRVL
jgi:hypothetical protein